MAATGCICDFELSCGGTRVLACLGCSGEFCVCDCGGARPCPGCTFCVKIPELSAILSADDYWPDGNHAGMSFVVVDNDDDPSAPGTGDDEAPEASAAAAAGDPFLDRHCNGGSLGSTWCGLPATVVCSERGAEHPLQWFACDDPAHQEGATTEPIDPWLVRNGFTSPAA
jgi:hypothetical protein